jgi:hypothetical protein
MVLPQEPTYIVNKHTNFIYGLGREINSCLISGYLANNANNCIPLYFSWNFPSFLYSLTNVFNSYSYSAYFKSATPKPLTLYFARRCSYAGEPVPVTLETPAYYP